MQTIHLFIAPPIMLIRYGNVPIIIIACIKQWYDLNKLVINTAKSNVMVVSSKQRHVLSGASIIDVRLGNENIMQINCIDYLGVKLDAHLTWNDQIECVCKKLV